MEFLPSLAELLFVVEKDLFGGMGGGCTEFVAAMLVRVLDVTTEGGNLVSTECSSAITGGEVVVFSFWLGVLEKSSWNTLNKTVAVSRQELDPFAYRNWPNL